MLYPIEEFKPKRKKNLVTAYVIVLLLVLGIAISIATGLGMFVSKKFTKNEEALSTSIEETIEDDTQEETAEVDWESFVENVKNIYNCSNEKWAFLTFDDGPSSSVTPYILDILEEHSIKATFFVLGTRVNANPDLVKQEYEAGHYIANHGYSHKYSSIYESADTVLEEYNKTEKAIQEALGISTYSSHLFRFPGGSSGGKYNEIKEEATKKLEENNIAYLDWNALTYDADGADTEEKIMSNLKKTVGEKKNVVILMHDASDKTLTYETLEDVIEYLEEQGYSFKNMYDLM